jgi:hypothetical protein
MPLTVPCLAYWFFHYFFNLFPELLYSLYVILFLVFIYIFLFGFFLFLLLCWVGVHCGIHKSCYNISNISYLNSPPPSFSFISPPPYFLFFWDKVSLYRSGWTGIYYVTQTGFELDPPASTSQWLGLQSCTTILSLFYFKCSRVVYIFLIGVWLIHI